jgi:hypothetical protein
MSRCDPAGGKKRLNAATGAGIMPCVRRPGGILVWVILLLWGLATWHCELEEVPGLQFLACCQHPGQAPHQDNDCEHDACYTVESGPYIGAGEPVSAPRPAVARGYGLWLPPANVSITLSPRSLPLTAPPELARVWRFLVRAAGSPRAPSVLS